MKIHERTTNMNVDSITACFNLYEKKMYHIAFSILHDSYQAEDAVMDAFLKLLKRKQSIDDPQSDETKRLIIQTIRSSAIDMYRKNQKRRAKEVSLEETEKEPVGSDDILIKEFPRTILDNLIGDLPDKYGSVLFERFYNGLSVRETALALGLTETTVRKRQERALKMLRERKELNGYA